MRAVNLMPGEARGGAGAAGSAGSGGAVYVLLAALAAFVVLAALWALAGKQITDRTAEVARVEVQVAAAEKRADDAAPYVAFAKLARNRVQTVTRLSTTRFDWAHAMREISRVLPADVWLSGMSGASGAGTETPTPATSAAPAPTITLLGCTHSQAKVARLMARLRAIDGVRRISLKSSEKPDAKGDASCPANRDSDPRFSISIAFAVPGAAPSGVDAAGQVVASDAAAVPASAGGASATSDTASTSAPVATDSKDG